ncbi:hypothetical protein MNBD_BACTEROID03-522, partial [hydrothermal vent metagenome]
MRKTYLSFLFILVQTLCLSQEDIVTNIKIQGQKKTKTSFLNKLITVRLGTVLDSMALQEDIERLKRLPSIAHAYFEVASSDGVHHNVSYHVEENFTLIPFANLYTSSNDDFAFRVGLQEFNLLQRNIMLGAFYQYDNFSSFGVSLRAPYLFSNKIGMALSYKDLTTQEPVFFDNDIAEYRYNNTGFEVMGLYEFNFKNRIELGASLFTENYEYLSGATSPQVPETLDVGKH